ncbi:lipoprotein-releasing system ATP-binding protein [Chitinophaga niastensis]|uniref:Lipoprotein-releasing system ATP-binding protein n=1 Tax=Chitinophaga niastensis TaxID=536980 RepID=A0A2P8HVH7_CHINA|nr:ABC transporter ATP-binding protein [Chitinophaga niastensis]PSL50216.1 lipoprotein-releasing system ATP-binding protein [Chitinophaga niastensis]
MLTARNVTKNYSNLPILKGVDITVSKGEIVTIVGSSGAGKSTLLHILGTLDTPTTGEVWLNNVNLTDLRGNALADFRNRHIGFIFQFHHLLPEFTALENVCIPGYIAGSKKSQVKEKAVFLLETLGLKNRLEHKPNALSGGEQQRVAVARALINNPDVVMADEPTGNLDSKNARELHNLFIELRDKLQQTFIIVTHNEELAPLSDRQLVMRDGKIIQGLEEEETIIHKY